MKLFSAVVLSVMAFSAYAANLPSLPAPEGKYPDAEYYCEQYTDNKIHPDGTTTDHSPIRGRNTIKETKDGFTFAASGVFKERLYLEHSTQGFQLGMAGNPNTLMLRKENNQGNPYFIVYKFEDGKVNPKTQKLEPGKPYQLITIATCVVK